MSAKASGLDKAATLAHVCHGAFLSNGSVGRCWQAFPDGTAAASRSQPLTSANDSNRTRRLMGVFSYDRFDRSALLVCDDCDRVLLSDDSLSEKTRRDSTPDELAPHFRFREDLPAPAVKAGWQATLNDRRAHALWTCPLCTRGRGGRAGE